MTARQWLWFGAYLIVAAALIYAISVIISDRVNDGLCTSWHTEAQDSWVETPWGEEYRRELVKVCDKWKT